VKRNPLRSERDAFRLFLLVGAAALFVIALALIFGSTVGAVVGFALLAFGFYHVMRWLREAFSAPEEIGDGGDEREDVPRDEGASRR
jgi:predicted PurR-regulated permease PerM